MWRISCTFWPTPLPWLPVLTNTEPPALRMKDDRLIETILAHESWPAHSDIFNLTTTSDILEANVVTEITN